LDIWEENLVITRWFYVKNVYLNIFPTKFFWLLPPAPPLGDHWSAGPPLPQGGVLEPILPPSVSITTRTQGLDVNFV